MEGLGNPDLGLDLQFYSLKIIENDNIYAILIIKLNNKENMNVGERRAATWRWWPTLTSHVVGSAGI